MRRLVRANRPTAKRQRRCPRRARRAGCRWIPPGASIGVVVAILAVIVVTLQHLRFERDLALTEAAREVDLRATLVAAAAQRGACRRPAERRRRKFSAAFSTPIPRSGSPRRSWSTATGGGSPSIRPKPRRRSDGWRRRRSPASERRFGVIRDFGRRRGRSVHRGQGAAGDGRTHRLRLSGRASSGGLAARGDGDGRPARLDGGARRRRRRPLRGRRTRQAQAHPRGTRPTRACRSGAQSRPLRPVDLGFAARPDRLVGLDVRRARSRRAARPLDDRRPAGADAPRGRKPRGDRAARRRERAETASTSSFACAPPTGAGCGCASARNSSRTRRPAAASLVGIAFDVTDRKREAEASATADQRLREAIEAISEAFVLWDSSNRLVLCNSKYQRLHNLSERGRPVRRALRRSRDARLSGDVCGFRQTGGGRPACAHLRGALAGRTMAAGQRTAHARRRLRLGRDRHHRAQGARRAVDEFGAAAAGDRGAAAPVAPLARGTGPAARRSGRALPRAEGAGGGRQSRQGGIPRQHEPRTAHAAQRDHRLFPADGKPDLRPAGIGEISRLLRAHFGERRISVCTSSATSSTCPGSRRGASGCLQPLPRG